jgi:hypothetical protein
MADVVAGVEVGESGGGCREDQREGKSWQMVSLLAQCQFPRRQSDESLIVKYGIEVELKFAAVRATGLLVFVG